MSVNLKAWVPTGLAIIAVILIAFVGHRHWIKPIKFTPPTATEVVEQPKPTTKPVVKPKPRQKPKAEARPHKPKKPHGPTRTCDANGWCWTEWS